MLRAVPFVNKMARVTDETGGALVEIPVRRPSWLVPPLSWVLPYSSHKRVRLDEAGRDVLRLCDGRRCIEDVIEEFGAMHKLSFRESQLPVMQLMRNLTERGILAIAGMEDNK